MSLLSVYMRVLEIILDLPFGFPINNIISLCAQVRVLYACSLFLDVRFVYFFFILTTCICVCL